MNKPDIWNSLLSRVERNANSSYDSSFIIIVYSWIENIDELSNRGEKKINDTTHSFVKGRETASTKLHLPVQLANMFVLIFVSNEKEKCTGVNTSSDNVR